MVEEAPVLRLGAEYLTIKRENVPLQFAVAVAVTTSALAIPAQMSSDRQTAVVALRVLGFICQQYAANAGISKEYEGTT